MMKSQKIEGGVITALVTPFDQQGHLDFDSLGCLIQQQLKGGVCGFVISGTTGESPNLSLEEIRQIYAFVKEKVPEGFPLILGAGTNSTQGTIDKVKALESLEPAAFLIVVPYYNKPTQEGLFQHFEAVAESTSKEILLYDVPGRTITELEVDTVKRLSQLKNVVGLKDATGNLGKHKVLMEQLGSEFLLFSGDDGTAAEYVQMGGHGVISVISHVIPKEFAQTLSGEQDFGPYAQLCDLLFKEPNPVPTKAMLKQMGLLKADHVRLPLVPATEALKQELSKYV